MAMAVLVRQEEIWKIMTEYKEMPDEVKFMQLSMLMSGARSAMVRREPMEQFKKKFEEMLHSVSSVEMEGQKSFGRMGRTFFGWTDGRFSHARKILV